MAQPYSILPAAGSDQLDEWIKLGAETQLAGNLPKAMSFYQSALRLDPNNATATQNLAVVLACSPGCLNDALLAIEKAVIFNPAESIIRCNQALICLEADRIDEGLAAAHAAVKNAPQSTPQPGCEPVKAAGYINSRLALAMLSASAGHPEESYKPYMEMLDVDPTHPAAGPNSCFVTSLMPFGPKELRAPRDRWYRANKVNRPHWPHKNKKDPDKVLKVGYVGGDFKSHSAAMMFSNVVLNHDRKVVEPFLYSSLPTDPEKDAMSAMFRAVGNFREVHGKNDDDFEAMIEADEIDILVDLAGHTNGGRLGVFCRKPAPVQVTAWGFAHGTGVPDIDYFFADPVAVQPDERQYYAERIYDLPCIVTYRPPVEYNIRPTSPAPALTNEYFRFGCFARFEKLSDAFLGTVKKILEGVPTSRVYFKDHAFKRPYSIRRVLSALEGIDPARIAFGGSTTHPEHLLEYQKVDAILDPYFHGGGIVSLETLYCGVPLLTMYGRQPSGRTASSVLTAIGRTDWIAKTEADYVKLAIEWANRPHDLAVSRKTLRQELLDSPVVKGYVQAVESAYRDIWKSWCQS